MANENVSVIKIRDILLVTVPLDPDDESILLLQERILNAMYKYKARGVIIDISNVETLDSFFARNISETAQMVTLMGGKTVIAGMSPDIAITITELGLALNNLETTLNVDLALDTLSESMSGGYTRGEWWYAWAAYILWKEIVAVRKTIRQEATRLGFNITDITRVVTAASELARNVYRYAKTGVMRWKVLDTGVNKGLEIIFEDHGPGIPNVDKAMEMGYSTGEGLGLGLPGTKRLADEMEIESAVGKGTKVTIRKWLRKF